MDKSAYACVLACFLFALLFVWLVCFSRTLFSSPVCQCSGSTAVVSHSPRPAPASAMGPPERACEGGIPGKASVPGTRLGSPSGGCWDPERAPVGADFLIVVEMKLENTSPFFFFFF